nr:TetR/AcrR family transcriptional regulator [Kineosporia babensis]
MQVPPVALYPPVVAENLRERTRRAVRKELSAVALDLFLEQGYEATTIEQIATAAGLSRRSFFRYFASKEALILGKLEIGNEDMVQALTERPPQEPIWTSLRRVFDDAVAYQSDSRQRERGLRLQEIIGASPMLAGAQATQFAALQSELVAVLRERSPQTPELEIRSLVSAAFACLQVALAVPAQDGGPALGEILDRSMAALRPLGAQDTSD